MNSSSTVPTQKAVLLLGAGNAHLSFVRMFGMRPVPGVAVTLVSEASVIPYSAMVPGHLARDYRIDEITIDLVRLCAAMKVRLVPARAVGLDVHTRKVSFAHRPELTYDVLSLGLGSMPARPPSLANAPSSWPMRPLASLIERLDNLERQLQLSSRPFHLVVVGGGASGCELTLAIRKRFFSFPHFRLTLLHSHDRLLPQFPARAGHAFADLMRRQDVTLRLDAQVIAGDDTALELLGGERLTYDAVLWATNAGPPDLLRDSGLRRSEDGFLLVHDTLQSLSHPEVFGTGDCIAIESYPDLPKNGVYAVREGGVLFDNVARFLRDRPLIPFRPQKRCLCLLNSGDGAAVFTYGPFTWKSRLVRWLKDRIDRAWIDKFSRFPAMTPTDATEEAPQMRCGGCGNKISSDVLSAVVKRLDVGSDPRVLLGVAAGEDASVHRVKPELFGKEPAKLVEVQTVDYFKAFVDDPYLFGRIAAFNSVSDLYAMNARPFVALAIATLPYARGPIQEAMLHELLTGAVQSLRQLGVTLTGGHTTEGAELSLGFAVTGFAEEDRLFQKSQLQAGDKLVLTKPLGSGALLAAWMRGECKARWYDQLLHAMLNANDRAAPILTAKGVRACTDVTGFGLAGHLLEMLDASRVMARIDAASVRLYDGFTEVVERGIVSSLHADNAKMACRVQGTAPAWLFDPQTSGGMLAGVKPGVAEDVVRALVAAGYEDTRVVGEVIPLSAGDGPSIHVGEQRQR